MKKAGPIVGPAFQGCNAMRGYQDCTASGSTSYS